MAGQSVALVCDPDPRRRQQVVSTLAAAGCDASERAAVASAPATAAERLKPDLAILAFTAASSPEAFAVVAQLRQTLAFADDGSVRPLRNADTLVAEAGAGRMLFLRRS